MNEIAAKAIATTWDLSNLRSYLPTKKRVSLRKRPEASLIKLPLATKLIAATVMLLLLLMGAVIVTVNYQMRQSILDEFLKRGLSVARNLAALNTGYVTTYNYVKLEQNLDYMVRDNELLYATVLFFDGEAAAYRGREDFKESISSGVLHDAALAGWEILVQYDTQRGVDFCEIAVPIFMDGEKWGAVRVGFPLDDMQNAIDRTKKVLMAIGALVLLVGSLAAYFLARRITRPVSALVHSVEAISQGDFNHTIPVTSQDEIGYFAERFASMQATVKEHIDLLMETNTDLTAANGKLNHEIRERQRADRALILRDALLQEVNYSARQFLRHTNWEQCMPDVLARLGRAAGLLHIYLVQRTQDRFVTAPDPAEVVADWRAPWADRSGRAAQIALSSVTQSVPIRVDNRVWGHICYVHNSADNYHGAEKNTLKAIQTVAGNLGSTIERRRTLDRLETANCAKDDFLANMSHELRTPLNHVIGFTELVMTETFGDLNDTQSEYLGDVLLSSRHLLSLINDILDLSKVEAGKVELAPGQVNISEVLANSLTMIKEKSYSHNIKLTLENQGLPEYIIADERKLKQVLYNLLANAVKFTPDGGHIGLTARLVDCILRPGHRRSDGPYPCYVTRNGCLGESDLERNTCLEVTVSDSGIGIPPEKLDVIFDRFDQVENNMSRRYQGTGLGLALAKNFIGMHGGQIWAESEGEGQGSKFRFVIPVE